MLPTPLVGGPTSPYFQNPRTGAPGGEWTGPRLLSVSADRSEPVCRVAKLDTCITNVTDLPPGPFQLTNSTTHPYDVYDNSPVHRFYQMWQQMDCNAANVTTANPSGCLADLFPWVEVTIGAGSNGKPPAVNFDEASTREGATSMAFYNVQQGDAPYLKYLADNYSMSDNYHQAVNGGTGANHIMMGTGDAIWFSDGNGTPQEPPHGQLVGIGTANQGYVDEIENPNPAPATNNWYAEDGYGGGSYGSPSARRRFLTVTVLIRSVPGVPAVLKLPC